MEKQTKPAREEPVRESYISPGSLRLNVVVGGVTIPVVGHSAEPLQQMVNLAVAVARGDPDAKRKVKNAAGKVLDETKTPDEQGLKHGNEISATW